MRTLTEAVAQSIAEAVSDFVAPRMRPDDVIVTGGGSRNTFLLERLRMRLAARFPGIVVEPGEAFGVNSDAKEACAFAYLAYLCLRGIPANVASQAAGLKPAVLGCVYPVG
jgi:anhydro-N-acetylmuramic acid kinase